MRFMIFAASHLDGGASDQVGPRESLHARAPGVRENVSNGSFTCVFALVGCLLSVSNLSAQITAKGMVIPVFVGSESKPTALVHVKELINDYRRVGFFRIGAMPLVVLDGLTIELKQIRNLSASFKEVHKGVLINKHPDLLEARDVRIIITAEETPRLQAKTMRFVDAGRWRFFDGILYAGSDHPVQFSQGTLQLHGPSAGRFTYRTGGKAEELQLFCDVVIPGGDDSKALLPK